MARLKQITERLRPTWGILFMHLNRIKTIDESVESECLGAKTMNVDEFLRLRYFTTAEDMKASDCMRVVCATQLEHFP